MLSTLVLLSFLLPCQTSIFSLDNTYPFLSTSDTSIQFAAGGGAYVFLSQQMIRIHKRGVLFTFQAQPRIHMLTLHWTSLPCNISSFSFCHTPQSEIFPSSSPRIGHSTAWKMSSCSKAKSKSLTSGSSYDISSCDVLDEQLHILYTQNQIFFLKDGMSISLYWTLVILCVYIIRSISINILSKFQSPDNIPSQMPVIAVNLILFLSVVCQGDSYYTTSQDYCFWCFSIFYISLYLCFHSYHCYLVYYFKLQSSKYIEPRVFNLSSACLHLVSMRLYGSVETPYVPFIIGLMSVRIWEKQLVARFSFVVTGLLDCLYMSLLISFGFTHSLYFLFPLLMFTRGIATHVAVQQNKNK